MKAVWNVARALVAAAALALGGGAQGAVVYDVNFDPVGFFGNGQIQIDQACLTDGFHESTEGCNLFFTSLFVHDSGGGNWFLDDSQDFTGFVVRNGSLVSIEGTVAVDFNSLDNQLTGFGVQSVGSCSGTQNVNFSTDGNVLSFEGCGGLDTGHYVIPEPASIGLTLAALGALWVGRRRRTRS